MHVDGFRFDLGTILAREPGGFDTHNGFMKAVMQDRELQGVKLIAEPWDCGPGGYQVGGFPPGWAEWNDKFRDTVRDFWRAEASTGALAPRLCASPDVFNHRGRQPWSSVNFITAHDGFTLNDLVSYNDKHNEANGENNQDGNSNNRSWNHGAEGPTDDAAVKGLRKRQMKNMLATLLLSQGTPMMLAGDERSRTQRGNNNAYCQDNEISWLDWKTDDANERLIRFVKKLTGLRLKYPVLRQRRFLSGIYNEELGVKDVAWVSATGEEMSAAEWDDGNARCFGMLLDGRAQQSGIRQRGHEATLLIIFNSWQDVVKFKLPAAPAVSAVGWGVFLGMGAIAATKAVPRAAKLPEYRQNIAAKTHALRHPDRASKTGKAAAAIKDLERQAAPERPPLPVKETPGTAFEALAEFAAPVAKPVAMALAVIVFTILMLVNRENMRDRLIGVLGTGRINAMTRAMAEASYRVSRYLATQLVVNAVFGIPFGIALYLIGIPNALLFGLLGMVLRFVPYAGVWIAAAMPAVLAFAISDSWTPVAGTLGVFLVLETLLAYVVEPWLYGKSAGLSPVAIIAAVMFWTWLWGPVGLLLATPLTVCVAVVGRHLPELGYLNVLLGVDPVLSPEQRFYQRLLALDHEDAQDMIEQ